MTEQEFDEMINDIYDVFRFCTDYPDYDYITDDVYNSEAMADYIKDVVRHINFDDVQDFLTFADAIPDSDWYHVQSGCIYALDFEELKNDLLEDLRSEEFFTDEEFINSDDSQNNTDMWVDINNNNTDTDDIGELLVYLEGEDEENNTDVDEEDNQNNTDTDDDIIANDISLLYS